MSMREPVSSHLPPALAAAEQRAREFLAGERWRKARDELKPLVRQSRERYLPLLIKANVGLAREMMRKGQTSEAHQVMDYLATIASRDQLRLLELELAAKSGAADGSTTRFVAALADPTARLSDSEAVRLVDLIILAFQEVSNNVPGQEWIATQVRAVHESLRALAKQDWDGVRETVRSIPHGSPFRHWAVFLKGLAAFHAGEHERAALLLMRLPSDSVPAKAGGAYLLLMDRLDLGRDRARLTEALLDGACRVAGQPSVAGLLLSAERLWRSGQPVDAYLALRDGLAQFPSEGMDWIGALSEFYFQAPQLLPAAGRAAYLGFFDGVLHRGVKNRVEQMLAFRMCALYESSFNSVPNLRWDWENYLELRHQLHGPDPRFASIGYGWLGERLAEPCPSPFRFQPETQLRDGQGAIECLNQAIALDPNNFEAHLQLTGVYRALRRHRQRNRLLDEMTRKFPEEKAVLLEAAAGSLERGAYRKALTYLERARRLDRLDQHIPDLLVVARRRLARQYFQQGQPEKGRQGLQETENDLTDTSEDLNRSRWSARLRHGLLELLFADAARGESLLAEARAASPFPAAFLLFAHLGHQVYAGPDRDTSPFRDELRAELQQCPNAARGLLLLRIVGCWEATAKKPLLGAEADWLRHYLGVAAKTNPPRAEARAIIELYGCGPFAPQARAFVKAILRRDPKDPLFRLFEMALKPPRNQSPTRVAHRLESSLDEARRRGDHETVQRIQGLLANLRRPPVAPMPPEPEPLDDATEIDEVPEPLEAVPEMSPADFDLMADLLNLLATASDAEIRKLRKNRPKGVPGQLFDAFVQLAKSGGALPPPTPGPAPRPGPSRTKPAARPPQAGPNQMDLF